MSHRCLASGGALAVALAVVFLAQVPVAGQAAAVKSAPVRTPDGQPDLQGIWTFKTITPLERPRGLEGKQVLTDAEVATFEEEQNRRQNRDLIDPAKGGANYPPGGVVPYNEFWYDRGNSVIKTKRSSLVTDPPDGRRPPMTPAAQQREDARVAAGREEQFGRPLADGPEDRDIADRCITNGLPRFPGAYNNQLQIVQTAGYVAIEIEMHHHVRIIPLDGRPHAAQGLQQWLGDSRGRWEGQTLVVETRNFNNKGDLSEKTRLVERFTRTDPGTISYEVTVEDPETWTRPWTASFPLTQLEDEVPQIYEYACHEGNYSIANVLRGARAQEAPAAKKGSR